MSLGSMALPREGPLDFCLGFLMRRRPPLYQILPRAPTARARDRMGSLHAPIGPSGCREFYAHAASGRCLLPSELGPDLFGQKPGQPRAQPFVLLQGTTNAVIFDHQIQ